MGNHGLALAYVAFLYGSVSGGGAGLAARLLGHKSLAALGEYSFEVFLFQYPVHEICVSIGDITGIFDMKPDGSNTNWEGFMFFFLVLWIVAGLYAEFVEASLVRLVLGVTWPFASERS